MIGGPKTSLAITIVCLLGSAPSASAVSLDELTPFVTVQHFNWKEYYGGSRILKEEGPLYSGGLIVGFATDASFTFRGRGELFGGQVDYRGQTQPPDAVPVSTDVTYFGTRDEFDVGYRLSPGLFRVEPFAGAGFRIWLRNLQDTNTTNGERVSGYTEYWDTWYARIGARGRYLAGSGISISAEGGARYPFYTGNTVDFENYGDRTLEPGGRWSGFGEAGVSYQRFRAAVSYEGLRFSQSPQKRVGSTIYLQPKSSADIWGINLGWNFW